jgi:hypothetical protein
MQRPSRADVATGLTVLDGPSASNRNSGDDLGESQGTRSLGVVPITRSVTEVAFLIFAPRCVDSGEMQKTTWGVLLGVLWAAGCGSVSNNHPTPVLVPGGGIGGGAIDGYVNLYVIDTDTNLGIPGASVQIGAATATACMGLTDSTGLVTFDPMTCAGLRGAVTLTASATGYAPSTWIGANGANMTINLQATTRPMPDTATVSGTIAGWESLPTPTGNHTTIALIGASQTPNLGDLANNIQQGTRNVSLGGTVLTTSIPANACVKNALADDCNWQLIAHTGPQAHYAIIVDSDNNGTPDDQTDDIVTPVGWALLTGLNLVANQTVTSETLPAVAAADLQTFTAAFPALPAGMTYYNAYPAIELPGGVGRIPAIVPTLGKNVMMTSIPKLTGTTTAGLAGGLYDLLAQAQATQTASEPATLDWMHGVNAGATVTLAAWLAPPTAITALSGHYSFVPTTGATVHSAEFKDPATGNRTWSVSIFDGSSSFTLPGLTPDPLATASGTDTLTVSALTIPGISLTDVTFNDATQKLTGLASDQITVTP